jgi:hypothetical protein
LAQVKTIHQIVLSDDYLAQAQRLTIKHNKALRLMYGSWWVWWVPRIALAFAIVFLLMHNITDVVWLPAGFIILSFAVEWATRRSLARSRKRARAKGSTVTVIMDETGLYVAGVLGTNNVKWAALSAPKLMSDGVLINLKRTSSLWLPDNCLVEGSPKDVRQILGAVGTDLEARTGGSVTPEMKV